MEKFFWLQNSDIFVIDEKDMVVLYSLKVYLCDIIPASPVQQRVE